MSLSSLAYDGIVYSPFRDSAVAAGAAVVNRSMTAALTFLAWDIVITMGDEVALIWPRAWSGTKLLYFFIRYVPLLVHISLTVVGTELSPAFHFTPHDCFIWQVFQGVAAALIMWAVDIVLILRVLALYYGSKVLPIVVWTGFAMEVCGMITGLVLTLPKIVCDELCLVVYTPANSLIVYGSSAMLFQTFLFAITFYKFIQAVRAGWSDVPLVALLMRDGTWAFFVLFGLFIATVTLLQTASHEYSGVHFGWLLTIFSFCGYRILLNINRLADISICGTSDRRADATDTRIQFSTQIFVDEESRIPTEIFELEAIGQLGPQPVEPSRPFYSLSRRR